jgi:hypothetical protein
MATKGLIDFRSDTVTMPTEEMLEAISHSEFGDDVFEEDPTVNKLEKLAAEKNGQGSSSTGHKWNPSQFNLSDEQHKSRRARNT